MRINQFVAQATGLSRRAADKAIISGRVTVNGQTAGLGDKVDQESTVELDSQPLSLAALTTIMLNKPPGYVCSRHGQGSRTVYDLLPTRYHELKPVGRLDKDSSGLLLLTNDGQLANQLTHPRYAKTKVYEVGLDKPLNDSHRLSLQRGIELADGPSKLGLEKLGNTGQAWRVSLNQGRNRQIRRSFEALGYRVIALHRTQFGPYILGNLLSGQLITVPEAKESSI